MDEIKEVAEKLDNDAYILGRDNVSAILYAVDAEDREQLNK